MGREVERVRLPESERALLTNTNPLKTKSSWTLTLVTRLVGFGLDASVRRN